MPSDFKDSLNEQERRDWIRDSAINLLFTSYAYTSSNTTVGLTSDLDDAILRLLVC